MITGKAPLHKLRFVILQKTKLKAGRLTNKQQLKVAAVQAWQAVSAFGDAGSDFGSSFTAKDLHPVVKNKSYICNCKFVQLILSLCKWGLMSLCNKWL